jgi:hypothetical protein
MASLFPKDLRGFRADTVPRAVASSGSSSRELYLYFRVLSLSDLFENADASNTFLEVLLPIATSTLRVHIRRTSQSHLRSVHSVSRAHNGLLLAVPCGLISSHCHVQDSPSRGFPYHQAVLTRRQASPHAVERFSPVISKLTTPDPIASTPGC